MIVYEVTDRKTLTPKQGPYTPEHFKFKAIQDFSRLFQKEIQDCFNDICTSKGRVVNLVNIKLTLLLD